MSPDAPRLRADAQRNRARILAAAEQVFAERGPSASTEEVATRAGVAIGTVFRHFPTKQALLAAIMKTLLARLTRTATELSTSGDPSTALFTFFTHVVTQAASQKTVLTLLTEAGTEVDLANALRTLHSQIAALLAAAQQAGAVRPDAHPDDVIALLALTCHGALDPTWTPTRQHRTLTIIFDGLRSHPPSDQANPPDT